MTEKKNKFALIITHLYTCAQEKYEIEKQFQWFAEIRILSIHVCGAFCQLQHLSLGAGLALVKVFLFGLVLLFGFLTNSSSSNDLKVS